jgi:hypothetical protein
MSGARQRAATSARAAAAGRADGLGGVRAVLAVTFALTLAASLELLAYAQRTGLLEISWKWRTGLLLAAAGSLGLALALAATWTRLGRRGIEGAGRGMIIVDALDRLGALRWPLLAALALAFPIAVLGPWGRYLQGVFPRLLVFWILASAAFALAHSLRREWDGRAVFLGTCLVLGGVHRLAAFLPDLSTYSFSLGWSEASRYYYASLFFAERIYGIAASPSVLHPTRYLMQSLPFLIPDLPLWFHRLWQVLLWVAAAAVAGALIAALSGARDLRLRWLTAVWAALFLFQGPVYYHLLVMVIAVLWGFRLDRPWRTSVIVLLASVWAGLSRINWFPVPGLLAAALYLLGRPGRDRSVARTLGWPSFWVLGGSAIAVVSQFAYAIASGNSLERFGTSFTSDLLWYRLWPNPTNSLGVLPSILLASAPLWAWIGMRWRARGGSLGDLRALGLAAILLVLLVGGLVVSVKIGGGSNLHNLDAYLVALAIVGAYVARDELPAENPRRAARREVAWGPLGAAALMPLLFTLTTGGPISPPESAAAAGALQAIRQASQAVTGRGESVLFIADRHLLTFGYVREVPLVPEYEVVFLMEMAMAGHRPYLDVFHQALRDHDFGLIVTYPLETEYQGRGHSFGEENDAWVAEVSLPVLCSYEPTVTLASPPLQLLVPRPGSAACPEGGP